MSDATITSVDVMTIQAQLPAPVVFGEWIMHTREFALVRVRTDRGIDGLMYTLTRDGAVAEQIRKTIAAHLRRHDHRRPRADVHGGLAPQSRVPRRGHRAACAVHRRPCLLGRGSEARATAPSRGSWVAPTGRCPRRPSSAIRRAPWAPTRRVPRPRSCTPQGWRRFKAPIGGSAERSRSTPAGGARRGPGRLAGHGCRLGLRRRGHRRRRSSNRSRTSVWAGSRTSSRPVTRASCADSVTGSTCPSPWATSRAAATSRRRSSSRAQWTWCGWT